MLKVKMSRGNKYIKYIITVFGNITMKSIMLYILIYASKFHKKEI